MKTFCRNGKLCQKFRTTDKPTKDKFFDSAKANSLRKNKTGHSKVNLQILNGEILKYFGVTLNEDNSNQIYFKERIKNANKTYFMLQKSFKNKNISKKLKLRLQNTQC